MNSTASTTRIVEAARWSFAAISRPRPNAVPSTHPSPAASAIAAIFFAAVEAAGLAELDVQDVGRLVPDDLHRVVDRVAALVGLDQRVDGPPHGRHALQVPGGDRLLEQLEPDVEPLGQPAQRDRLLRGVALVRVRAQGDVGPDGLPDRAQPLGVGLGAAADLRLERPDAPGHEGDALGGHRLRLAAGDLDGHGHPALVRPAEQRPDRDVEPLSGQVVQRHVDARSRAGVLAKVDQAEQVLAVERILADELRTQVVLDGHLHLLDGLAEEADVGLRLAVAADAVIGVDAHDHVLEHRRGPLRRDTAAPAVPVDPCASAIRVIRRRRNWKAQRPRADGGDPHGGC